MITVYSRPGCGACDATKLWLKRNKIEFVELDVSVDNDAWAHVAALGTTQMPVIETEGDHWSGFRIEKLATLKTCHPRYNNGVIDP